MSAADAQLKSIIDRVLRLKEEQDELAIEIREIYAEAKGNGYDKTALGQVVSHLRKVEKVGRDAVTERETMFDLYLSSYETGTTLATDTHEAKIGYAAQKGIDPKLAHTIVTGMQTETGRKALVAAVDIMIEREERIDAETGEILDDTDSLDGEGQEAPSSDVEADAANVGGNDVDRSAERAPVKTPTTSVMVGSNAGRSGVTAGETAPNSPETANEMDRTAEGSFETGSEVAENARKAIPAAGSTLQEDGSVIHAGADESSATNSEITPDPRPLTAADGQPRIPSSSPGCAKSDGAYSVVGQGRESENCITGNQEEHAVDQFTPPAFLAQKSMRDFRPHCQRPDACGASGLKHCYSCSKLVPSVGEVA